MKTIKISEFKERSLSILGHLGPEGLVVTKHGKPLARVLPYSTDPARLIGSLKGKLKVKGRILSTGLRWSASSSESSTSRETRPTS